MSGDLNRFAIRFAIEETTSDLIRQKLVGLGWGYLRCFFEARIRDALLEVGNTESGKRQSCYIGIGVHNYEVTGQ